MSREQYNWNPVFNIVMNVKDAYNEHFKDGLLNLERWLEKLDMEQFNEFFNCLQINQDGDIVLIRYGLAEVQNGMWQDEESPYREARSVVIDIRNEEIVIAPFRKFFNLNEVKENNLDVIREEIEKAKVFEITDKMDGSMQCARYYNHDIIMCGSMALNQDNSWRLKDGYRMLTNNHKEMIAKNQNLTFIFEYISLKDSHVVCYNKEQEGLYLIGIRDVFTGYEYSYSEIRKMANKFNVPMTKIEKLSLDDLLVKMKEYKSNEKEGWVINIDGHKVKVKCDDYCDLHRMLDKISSVNVIIKNIAEDHFDDLISKVPESYQSRVMGVAEKIFEWKKSKEQEIDRYYKLAPKTDRKTFMIWVDTNCDKDIKGYVKSKYLGQEYNVLKGNCNNYKKLSDLGIVEEYSALFVDLE